MPRKRKPPPPPTAPGFGDSHTWRNTKLSRQNAKTDRQNEAPECGKGGQFCHLSNNSTMKQYFKMLLSHRGVCFFPSLYCSVKLCSSPSCVLWGGKCRAYKTAPKLVTSPQSTILHSTGNISAGQRIQEQSRPQQHTWNSKLFVIFPAEITTAQSLHFQHFMWTEVMSSRRL